MLVEEQAALPSELTQRGSSRRMSSVMVSVSGASSRPVSFLK